MRKWHQIVVAAWLRRQVSTLQRTEHDTVVAPQSPDYHPSKAVKIYNRFRKIIDLYA